MIRHKRSSKLLAIRSARFLVPCVVVVAVWGHLNRSASADDRVNPTALAFKEFTDRVKDYVALQNTLESAQPTLKPSNDPADIEAHRTTLAAAIRKARQGAKRGETFGSAEPLFREIVLEDARDRTRRDAYAAMQEVPKRKPPAVNAEYPEKAAVATVPPLLLAKLPPLPENIEYRFMGRDLILLDAKSNVIIDFIHESVPTIEK